MHPRMNTAKHREMARGRKHDVHFIPWLLLTGIEAKCVGFNIGVVGQFPVIVNDLHRAAESNFQRGR